MRILICENNKDKIQNAIDECHGAKDVSRILTYELILQAAEIAQCKADRLLKKHCNGLQYRYSLNKKMPSSYKYKYNADYCTIEYTPKGWTLVQICRSDFYPGTPDCTHFRFNLKDMAANQERHREVASYLLNKFLDV